MRKVVYRKEGMLYAVLGERKGKTSRVKIL